MFAAPSPKNTNNAGLYLTKAGSLIDKRGAYWGRSQIVKLAMDAMPHDLGERDHERRGTDLQNEMQKLVDDFDLHDEVGAAIMALYAKHFPVPNRRAPGPDAVRGKGARDGPLSRHRAPGGDEDDDDDDFAEKVRAYLSGKGLSDDDVEKAIEIARRDRAAKVADELPENAIANGPPIKCRVESDADLEKEFPGFSNTTADPYGEALSARREREADEVRREGERIGSRLPSGGVSRRLSNDVAFDAELTQLIENVKVGVFG